MPILGFDQYYVFSQSHPWHFVVLNETMWYTYQWSVGGGAAWETVYVVFVTCWETSMPRCSSSIVGCASSVSGCSSLFTINSVGRTLCSRSLCLQGYLLLAGPKRFVARLLWFLAFYLPSSILSLSTLSLCWGCNQRQIETLCPNFLQCEHKSGCHS